MITIKLADAGIEKALSALVSKAKNPKPAMKDIGLALAENTRLRFVDQKGPDGQAWKPLQPATLARRRKEGKGAQILLDTGRLRNSITYLAGDTFVRVGTNVVYARTHQEGAKKGQFGAFSIARTRQVVPLPWGDIPARPFLGLSQDDRDEILEILGTYLAA